MRKKLGCLHAHHSNIEYIEQAFKSNEDIELIHFVDPGVIHQVAKGLDGLALKVREQIGWIVSCDVDAILITCTNYIALLEEQDLLNLSIPILKIDEPFFASICSVQQPQTILFTNPATVEGTMTRLQQYAKQQGISVNVVAKVIEHTFDLIMQGKKEAYNDAILRTLYTLSDDYRYVSVAQLSMVDAAQQFEEQTAITIHHPLRTVADVVMRTIEI
ncbi:hypothetical protein [Lysinibacillus cavernae]|uniref:hypothetical protein n=1 Tax=Lysinibacillus cavernae TaxID=2666135 RepID=UPI0012D95BEF|nr:hypothetical protein [Lysinibacillus cavernae]